VINEQCYNYTVPVQFTNEKVNYNNRAYGFNNRKKKKKKKKITSSNSVTIKPKVINKLLVYVDQLVQLLINISDACDPNNN